MAAEQGNDQIRYEPDQHCPPPRFNHRGIPGCAAGAHTHHHRSNDHGPGVGTVRAIPRMGGVRHADSLRIHHGPAGGPRLEVRHRARPDHRGQRLADRRRRPGPGGRWPAHADGASRGRSSRPVRAVHLAAAAPPDNNAGGCGHGATSTGYHRDAHSGQPCPRGSR